MSRGGVCISSKLKQIASLRTARDRVVVLKLGYASESPAKTQDSGAAYKLSDGALAWHSRLQAQHRGGSAEYHEPPCRDSDLRRSG